PPIPVGGPGPRRVVRFVTLCALIAALGAVASVRAATPSHRGALLVRIDHKMAIRRWPGAGVTIGWMPARSRYYRQPIRAWVLRTADGGRYGKVPVPYTAHHRAGWIDLRGLRRARTSVRVLAHLSR